MTASRTSQVAISSGEIDPTLHWREDFQRHQTGAAICRGFLPMRQGGGTRAPGTFFKGTTLNNQRAVRIPFVFARNDAVELEFTEGAMRIWRYGSLVLDEGVPYELPTPFLEEDLVNLNWSQDADVMYLLDGRNPMQQLSRFALDSWTLAPAELEAGPFRPQNLDEGKTVRANIGNVAELEVWVAYEVLVVGNLRLVENRIYEFKGTGDSLGTAVDGDVGFLAPTHTSGVVAYVVSEGPPQLDAYWEYIGTTAQVQVGGVTTVELLATGNIFTPDHVGALMRLEPEDWRAVGIWVGNATLPRGSLVRWEGNVYQIGSVVSGVAVYEGGTATTGVTPPVHTSGEQRVDVSNTTIYRHISSEVGIVKITSVTDENEAEGLVIEPIPQPIFDEPTYRWSLGAWNRLFDHPRFLAWFQQRMFAAGAPSDPRTLFASEQGAYRSFLPGDDATSSFAYDIGGGGSRNAISWLLEGKRGIYVGSLGEVRRGYADNGEAIGPTTFKLDTVSGEGAAPVRPVTPYGWPLYVSSGGDRLLEVRFDLAQDEMDPVDLSLPAAHLGAPGFLQIVWQSGGDKTGWIRRGDGTLCAFVYDPKQDVLGWAPVPVAGGFVEDICSTPSADGARDVVTMIVRRTINGQQVRCIEEMADNSGVRRAQVPAVEANHAYCALTFTADPASATFDVPHLVGETVAAWTDEGGLEDLVVAEDGTVTLKYEVTRAIIGLFDETHKLRSLPLIAAARDGDSRGRRRKIEKGSAVMVSGTSGGYVRAVERNNGGAWASNSRQLLFDLPVLAPQPVVKSGTLRSTVTSAYADEVAIEFEPRGLAPMTITGWVAAIKDEGV